MTLLAIDHLCLDVADMERAKAFWMGKLGFQETAPEHVAGGIRTAFLKGDGVIIDLKCPLEGAVAANPHVDSSTAGFNHVAFGTDDIQRAYEELEANGVAFDQEPRYMAHSGRWIAIFHDPDGNCLHLTM
ncbi:MAG: VOC family protein [Anaerolineae bacterium]|nr:VOC family protein [Anaerolineae bacterium]